MTLPVGAAPRPLRFAVVGFGYWGPNFVRNLYELPDAELVAVCDARPAALDVVRRRHPSVSLTTDYSRVVNDDAVDAVIIATPIATHYELARLALSAGKHVLVEKPLAASAAQAEALIVLADHVGRVLMPGHTFVYSPPVNVIRRLIEGGSLGDIHFISTSRVNLGLHQPDVSVISDLGPHDFSILEYWLGQMPAHVSALSQDCVGSGTPDVAFVNLGYDARVIAHVELSWLAPSKLRRTTIVGSKKMVVYDDVHNEPVRIYDSGVELRDPDSFGEYRLTYRTGDIISPRIEPREPLYLELEDFASAIRNDAEPRSNARLGLDVVRVIEAAHQSLEQGGARVATHEFAAAFAS